MVCFSFSSSPLHSSLTQPNPLFSITHPSHLTSPTHFFKQFKTMENLQTQTQAPSHNQTLQTDQHQQHPPVAVVECPRCNSMNTKFCYYNNYNLSQPRHFCKNCRRYWTKGGALRNIPVGGGTRKNSKRASSAHCKRPTKTVHVSSAPQAQSVSSVEGEGEGDHPLLLDCGVGVGSFSSLLASNGHLGNYCHGSFLGGLGSGEGEVNSSSVEGGGIGIGNDALWPGSWAGLSIYTPGPTFQ